MSWRGIKWWCGLAQYHKLKKDTEFPISVNSVWDDRMMYSSLSLHPQNKTSSNRGKLNRFRILRMRHMLIYLTSSVIRSNTEYWILFWSSHLGENHQSGVQTRAFKAIRVCAYYIIWEIAEGTEGKRKRRKQMFGCPYLS